MTFDPTQITYWVHGIKVVCNQWMGDEDEPYRDGDTWIVNERMWYALKEQPDFMGIPK